MGLQYKTYFWRKKGEIVPKKNKYIIEIPIKTYASKEEVEEKVKRIMCDYQVVGHSELERINFDMINVLDIKVR